MGRMECNFIEEIYSEYLENVAKAKSERKFTDGLMGFGTRADSHPCHDTFYKKLEGEISEILTEETIDTEIVELMRYIYEAPLENKDNTTAYWMMMAAHSLTERLIPIISGRQAEELAAWYAEAYPRHQRLPAQDKILKALKKHAKEN